MGDISAAGWTRWFDRRRIGLLFAAIGLMWLSLAVTIDQVLGSISPAVVQRWAPWSASAAAAQASALTRSGATVAQLDEAARQSRAALARAPLSVAGARSLGQLRALRGDLAGADRLFSYAEQLSRRDLLTELWLLEAEVRRGSVPGALVHYDRALRTHAKAAAVLYPVLVTAAADPNVVEPLSKLLAGRPPWAPDFLAVAAESPQLPPEGLARLFHLVRLDASLPGDRPPLLTAMRRLTAAGRYAEAEGIYRQAATNRARSLLNDGSFEGGTMLPPFDWILTQDGDLSATREPGGHGMQLALRATNGRSGDLARQLLVLAPGSYQISFISANAGSDPLSRAMLTIGCANRSAEMLRVTLSAITRTRSTQRFVVPPGCPGQWISIAAPAGLGESPDASPVLIDDIDIRAVAGGSSLSGQERQPQ